MTSRQKKIIGVLLFVLVVVAALFFFWRSVKEREQAKDIPIAPPITRSREEAQSILRAMSTKAKEDYMKKTGASASSVDALIQQKVQEGLANFQNNKPARVVSLEAYRKKSISTFQGMQQAQASSSATVSQ